MPRISIIVPVYKVERYIHACIDSILNQTMKDFELILVDDGSPDRCGAICDAYAQRDNRVIVIHQKNRGLSGARNAGLEHASGDYIGFVDSDDTIQPEYYETLYHFAKFDRSDIVAFTSAFIDDCAKAREMNASRVIVSAQDVLLDFHDKYYQLIWTIVMTKLYKRDVFENIRFKEGIIYEDAYIFPELMSHAKQITILPYSLYSYTLSDNSIMRSPFSSKRFHRILCWKHYVDFFDSINACGQRDLYARDYFYEVVKMYFTVRDQHEDLMPEYECYLKEFIEFKRCLRKNVHLSRMQLLLLRLFPRFPQPSRRIFRVLTR